MPALLIGVAALIAYFVVMRALSLHRGVPPRALMAAGAIAVGSVLAARGLVFAGALIAGLGGAMLLPYARMSRRPGGTHDGGETTAPVPIDLDEAYAVLGLERGATADEVKAAHRRLIARVHPDRGGSGWMAAKLNRAKDTILESLR